MFIGLLGVVVAASCCFTASECSHLSQRLPHQNLAVQPQAALDLDHSSSEPSNWKAAASRHPGWGTNFAASEEAEAEKAVAAEEAYERQHNFLHSRAAAAPAPSPVGFAPAPALVPAGEDVEQEADAALGAADETDSSAGGKSGEEPQVAKLEKLEKEIARDTDSEALADLLGGMKMDIFELQQDVKALHKDLNDGVELQVDDPYKDLVYHLSTAVRCIIMLTAQYFIVYTCLACTIVFTNLFNMSRPSHIEQALRSASDTMFYAPMLCVLFLGTQLRAEQITEGKAGPQAWAELAMEVCVWAVFAQTLLVLSIPMFSGEMVVLGKRGRALEWEMPSMENQAMARFLTLFRYIAMGALYGGITVVCIAVATMDSRSLGADPVDLWDDPTTLATEYAPAVSSAMICTIGLTFFFFLTYLVHAGLRTCLQLSGGLHPIECTEEEDLLQTMYEPRTLVVEWERCLRLCTQTVDLAPMLCLLFLCVRLHALHLDMHGAKIPLWVEDCFYIAVAALIVQAVAIVAERVAQGKCRLNPTVVEVSNSQTQGMIPEEGGPGEAVLQEDIFDLPEAETIMQRFFLMLRYICLVITAGVAAAIVMSLWFPNLFWHSAAAKSHSDEPLPPTTMCIGVLAGMYFTTYLGLFTSQRLAVLAHTYDWGENLNFLTLRALSTFERALQAVKFCPMLCALFFATRMRALQLSKQQGSPQCWTQSAMYITTCAVALQVVVVLLSSFISGGVRVEEGRLYVPNPKVQHALARMLVEFLQLVTFLSLYGGTITIVAGVLTMRPETAKCQERGFPGLPQMYPQ
mmetsp:Transcript_737/g.1542  ORF Transcript_737/g.1542 Transcript_737/m.1542 type:complete len:803 (-) Transcript_737:122-2530(-)|eukprot:CAMPEP_0178412598 /NCGR_PEP_ID=MMETSP0689_2-20121128/22096_1 /TAXON_ID=160604 /ORGANISM="Amphidinium massartii, Strain CS-259" /LENGTH=802 /DNA_ID=CAMNT_0020033847 /DNA_START=27 /DNA_END=2435 /DNA_ORIENTATION=-